MSLNDKNLNFRTFFWLDEEGALVPSWNMALGGDQERCTATSSIFICKYKNQHKQQKRANNAPLTQRNLQLLPAVLSYMSTDVKTCMAKKPRGPPPILSHSCCATAAALTSSNGIRRLKSPGAPQPIAGENQNCNAAFLPLAAAPSSSL